MRWLHQNVPFYWLFLSAVIHIHIVVAETVQQYDQDDITPQYPPSGSQSSASPSSSPTIVRQGTTAATVGNSGQQHHHSSQHPTPVSVAAAAAAYHGPASDSRSSYAMLSQAMSKAVSHEFSISGSGSADGSCHADDLDCFGTVHDRLEMEAIRSLHQQLDDDDNGNIDIAESDDFLREELKYDSGYEKRHRAFHYNDDMHISVKELWEAWLRSEVHNWTVEQTTEWLAQSVQLPQYVELFKQHRVGGATLPRLAVNNMHYVSNVLGIKDPIHKQKIALKAMDVVLFGPPRETGTRWKDYILVTLLLSVIFGCWYGYQQNKNSKTHLRRMAKDMEGLQKAEQALCEMQKELERARMEQENVATQKMDLERRLKETPSLSSSSSDLEVQQLKQEIEMLRTELSRAEIELVDHCWSPPQGLQTWLQLTYEYENKNSLVKRRSAEKQLQAAREACEKLKKKRTSLVGAFVSTHGKSIDDVDRSIVEARNSLSEVTQELQERMHRWKQIEQIIGFNIVNNNGLAYLENVLYSRNGAAVSKLGRGRMTSSQDELDDESVQGCRTADNHERMFDESSASGDEGEGMSGHIVKPVKFIVGSGSPVPSISSLAVIHPPTTAAVPVVTTAQQQIIASTQQQNHLMNSTTSNPMTVPSPIILPLTSSSLRSHNSLQNLIKNADSLASLSSQGIYDENNRHSLHSQISTINDQQQRLPTAAAVGGIMPLPRAKKIVPIQQQVPPPPVPSVLQGKTPMPPPRRSVSSVFIKRSQSTDMVTMEPPSSTSSIGSQSAATATSISTSNTSSSSISSSAIINNEFSVFAAAATTATKNFNDHSNNSIPPSSDSSIVDDEYKKRRRKIHFPFGKKSSIKSKSNKMAPLK